MGLILDLERSEGLRDTGVREQHLLSPGRPGPSRDVAVGKLERASGQVQRAQYASKGVQISS